ncbi:MAG: response regulator [Chloroflexota bacterium]|nr:response regulator [Chloroflexota bacterium]
MSKRILIVEDSPTEALRARLILEQEGYQVSLAGDGKEGLAKATEERPDLIVLDTIMPQMSGYEVYPSLRVNPETAHIPVLMLLTGIEATEVPRRLGLGADTYIAKPYTPPLLLSGIEEATKAYAGIRAENGLRQVVQTLDIGWVVLRDGCIVSVDPAAETLFGLDADELTGKPFVEYLRDDHSSFTAMISQAESDDGGQGEFKVRVDGREESMWWRICATPAVYEGQVATQLACLDVTAGMRSEEEIGHYSEDLQQARQEAEAARRAKTDFLANMSHELRTPLYGFMGTVDLVLDTELTPEQRNYLDTAKTSANALLAIVSDILEFSEIEAGQLSLEEKGFDLWAAVEEAAEIMAPHAQEKGLEFSHGISPQVPRLLVGDPRRLRQVLTNLIGNAIKFTEQGTVAVWVEVGGANLTPQSPSLPGEGKHESPPLCSGDGSGSGEVELHFLVRDTGIGIPKDKQETVFEAFQQADDSATRQYGGIGLRLDISRRLVGLMGGGIWVDSDVGRGSTFHFTITLRCQEEPLQPLGEVTRPTVEKRAVELRILLAEDSPTNQLIAVSNLKKAGHTVQVTDNGRKAVQAFAEGEFDLVLMDVAMPEMDGLEATQVIREREKESGGHIPIVAMTAFATKEYRKKCLEAGMDAYVTKPVSPDELNRTIEPLLRAADLGGFPKPPRSRPPVDLGEALEVVGDDVELLQTVVEMSLGECPEQIEALREALAGQDAPGVEGTAHRLKGVLGNLGGLVARDVAQRLETMGEEGNLDGGLAVLEELEREMGCVMAFYSEPGWVQDALEREGE